MLLHQDHFECRLTSQLNFNERPSLQGGGGGFTVFFFGRRAGGVLTSRMNEEQNSCGTVCSGLECRNIASDCQRMPYITRPTGRRQAAQLRVRTPEPGPAREYIHASQKKRRRKGDKQVDRTERDAAPRPAKPYMNVRSRWRRLIKEQRGAKRGTRDSTGQNPHGSKDGRGTTVESSYSARANEAQPNSRKPKHPPPQLTQKEHWRFLSPSTAPHRMSAGPPSSTGR